MLKRAPALVSWTVLFAMEATARSVQIEAVSTGASTAITARLLLTFTGGLIGGLLIFFLARTLLAPPSARFRPQYGQFGGLVIAVFVTEWLLGSIARTVIILNAQSRPMVIYGSVLAMALPKLLTFPFLVRALIAGAGYEEPRLGGVAQFSFAQARSAYLWYAMCTLVFPALLAFAFANFSDGHNRPNDLSGNLLQSLITSTGILLRYLLAIVVAKWMMPSKQRLAETFA